MWQFNTNTTMAFFFSSVGFYLYDSTVEKDLTVETSYGKVEGLSSVSRDGKDFYEFLGIPYAKPPVGDLRFAPPVFPEAWNGTRDATYMGSKCLQIDMVRKFADGDEDCLYLNVFTHQIQNTKQDALIRDMHPVLLYLHGGIFMFGSADRYRPKYFMDEDVVLVTINHRLASFGFLNLGHKDAAGNMGLKDQVKALQWVRDNIRYFGGDPNRVTIMGESAGAVSAHYHMLSNMSTGFFHRIISQSGNALAPWALKQRPLQQGQGFATKLNCRRNSTAETIACLKQLDASLIADGHLDSLDVLYGQHAFFGPTVETVKNSETFLSDLPINIIKSKSIPRVPWMAGVNSEEGILFAALLLRNETARLEFNRNWTYWGPKLLEYDYEPTPRKDEISRRIWNYYIGPTETRDVSWQTLDNVTNVISDRLFFSSLHNLAKLEQIDPGDQPMYLYYFSYPAKFGLGKLLCEMSGDLPLVMDAAITTGVQWFSHNVMGRPTKHYGTSHADEVFLMFNFQFQQEHTRGTQDYEMSKTLVEIWSTFARDGEPPQVQNYRWPPVGQKEKNCSTIDPNGEPINLPSIQYLKLDNPIEVIDEPFTERMNFWNSLNISTF